MVMTILLNRHWDWRFLLFLLLYLQVGFNSSRFSICFSDRFTPGTQNDCIVTSGGTADRGALAVLTKDIPTGSGIHKLLPNLGNAGKCVNVIRLKNSQQAHVRVFRCRWIHVRLWFPQFCQTQLVIRKSKYKVHPFFVLSCPVIRLNKLNSATLEHKRFWQ